MQIFKPVFRWWSFVNPRLIAHFSETLEVRNDRLIFIEGIFDKNEKVIPFSSITNYSADQTFFDRIFQVADFTVETAGTMAPELELNGYSYELREILSHAIGVR